MSLGTLGFAGALAFAVCIGTLSRPWPVASRDIAARESQASVDAIARSDASAAVPGDVLADLARRIDALERAGETGVVADVSVPPEATPAAKPEPFAGEATPLQQLLTHASYEARDAGWALSVREDLSDLVLRLEQLGIDGTEITATDCRTTVCVVELAHADAANRSLLPVALAIPAAAGVTLQVSADDPAKSVAVFARYRSDPTTEGEIR